MLTTILSSILPEMYRQAGYLIQDPPAEVQSTDPAMITVIRGFGTEIVDRPVMAINRSGGVPQSFWWLGNMGQTNNGEPVQLSYWHDEAQVVFEVPQSSGGEVFLDQLVQTYMQTLTENYNVLVQPPPAGYGLYFPHWSAGGITETTQQPGGHLMVRSVCTFSATVPVAGIPETDARTRIDRFELIIAPLSNAQLTTP